MKKIFLVDKNFNDIRFDRWFKKKVCSIPQSLLEKNIRKSNIKVNNKKIKSSHKLYTNDKVIVYNYDFLPNLNKKKTIDYAPTARDINLSSSLFIENNENFVVLNKPYGISVQSGTKSRRNIMDIIKKTKEFSEASPYTVHRIDKETTGILLVAKNRKYAQLFTSMFRLRKINKTYLGIMIGEMEQLKGVLTDDLLSYQGDKKIISKAITHYKVLDTNRNYTLLKLNPVTGRKHQIRKQLLLRGHPILGDKKYRISKNYVSKNDSLMLHAYKINFSINEKRYNFIADPPILFKKMLKEKYLKIF